MKTEARNALDTQATWAATATKEQLIHRGNQAKAGLERAKNQDLIDLYNGLLTIYRTSYRVRFLNVHEDIADGIAYGEQEAQQERQAYLSDAENEANYYAAAAPEEVVIVPSQGSPIEGLGAHAALNHTRYNGLPRREAVQEFERNLGRAGNTPKVPDATYTVVDPNGDYVTVRLQTQPEDATFAPGKRVASFLSGQDNDNHFTGFAFVNGFNVNIYKKWANSSRAKWYADAVRVVLGHPARSAEFMEAYAEKSKRCARCGRTLTVPASLHRGVGPECARHLGLA